jgi:hypothetical protein
MHRTRRRAAVVGACAVIAAASSAKMRAQAVHRQPVLVSDGAGGKSAGFSNQAAGNDDGA